MKQNQTNKKRSTAVLEFIRTPYYKPRGPLSYSSPSLVKSCLVALFEKNPEAKTSLKNLLLTGSTHNIQEDLPLDGLKLSLEFNPSLNPLFMHYGCTQGLNTFLDSHERINHGLSDLLALGAIDFSKTQSSESLKKTKHEITKYKLRIKKSLPELSNISDTSFLELVPFKYASAWQKDSHKNRFTREAQDQYTLESFRKFFRNKKSTNEIVSIFSKEPHFQHHFSDTFATKPEELDPLNKQNPLTKDSFSSLTARNTSFFTEGVNVLLLADSKKAKELGYEKCLLFIDSETSKEEAEVQNIETILQRNNLNLNNIDAFEISEITACSALASIQSLNAPSADKINFFGGSLAYGYTPSGEALHMISNLKKTLELKNGVSGLALIKSPEGHLTTLLFQRKALKG